MKENENIIKLPSSSKIENVEHKNESLSSNIFQLPFYKTSFIDFKDYVKFIKQVEKVIRTSDDYKSYINYLKTEINLNYCQFLYGIDDEKATIEMHHGPILTLYDYVDIVTNYHCVKKDKFTTLSIAEEVLNEHFENRVQIVMLSKSAHDAVHTGKLFINPNQAWGNLNDFLVKYEEGLTEEQINKINSYLIISKTTRSNDNGLLESKEIEDWSK